MKTNKPTKKIVSALCILFAYCFSASSIQAQVTIGLGEEPNEGSLLHLKEIQDRDSRGRVNASKGLCLPRVNITDGYNLYPMFLDNPAEPLSGPKAAYVANKADIDNTHTGLMVYNMNATPPFMEGLYTWNGTAWVYSDGISPWHIADMEGDVAATHNDQNIYQTGQVVIGDNKTDKSAVLKVTAPDKGVLLPQVELTGRNDKITIQNPASGLLVYNTGAAEAFPIRGYMFWDGSEWLHLRTSRLVAPEATLHCGQARLYPGQVIRAGVPLVAGTVMMIPYTVGNRGLFNAAILLSTAPGSDVKATISEGLLEDGAGYLAFNLTGTPTAEQVSPAGITFGLQPFYDANPTIDPLDVQCKTVKAGPEIKSNIESVAVVDNLKLVDDAGVTGYATQVTTPDGKFSVRAFIVSNDFNSSSGTFGTDGSSGINLQVRNNTSGDVSIAGQFDWAWQGAGGNGDNYLGLQPGLWSGDSEQNIDNATQTYWANYVSDIRGSGWSQVAGAPNQTDKDHRGHFVYWGNLGIYAAGRPERRTYSWMINDGAVTKTAYILTYSSSALRPVERAGTATCPDGICTGTKIFMRIDEISAP